MSAARYFWSIGPAALHRLGVVLARHELADEPNDWVVMTLRHLAESFSVETRHFASAYLIGHGILKIFLAVTLLRERLWAFPTALSVLAIFVAYQLHRFVRTHSIVLLALTVVDLVVMVLIWREYRSRLEAFLLLDEASGGASLDHVICSLAKRLRKDYACPRRDVVWRARSSLNGT